MCKDDNDCITGYSCGKSIANAELDTLNYDNFLYSFAMAF